MTPEPTEPAGHPANGGLAAGAEFAGLVVEAEVGRGGMGVIYRARDRELDRVRALKVLAAERSADREFRERFRRESRQAAAIEHPNVIPVYRAGEEAGRLYLVMRFVDGPSLADVLADRGRLPLDETLDIVAQVAAGLDAAHAVGLVHRDMKPGNVLLEGGRAFLGDFGISKLAEAGDALTSTGQFVGTVDYVAPEQLEGGTVDRRADVYSLACVAFHALSGERPFPRETQLATMFAHANAPRPDAGPQIPSKVREALKRGMAVDPGERPASAGELAAELERAAGASSIATTERLAVADRRGARRLFVVAGVAGALAAVAAIVLLVAQDDPAPPSEPPLEATTVSDLAPRPRTVTIGPQQVWVASPASGTVTAIDPVAAEPLTQRAVGEEPADVAVGLKGVWVADRDAGTLLRLDPETLRVAKRKEVGGFPVAVAVGTDDLWVADAAGDVVLRVDPGNLAVEDRIGVGADPVALSVAEGDVWVACRDGGGVVRIDERSSRRVGNLIPTGPRPSDVAADASAVWVTDNLEGTVTRIDPETPEPSSPVEAGAQPTSVSLGGGFVWVASEGDSSLRRFAAETGAPIGEPLRVGRGPADVAVAGDVAWTANSLAASATRLAQPR